MYQNSAKNSKAYRDRKRAAAGLPPVKPRSPNGTRAPRKKYERREYKYTPRIRVVQETPYLWKAMFKGQREIGDTREQAIARLKRKLGLT